MRIKNPTHIGAVFALIWIIIKLAMFQFRIEGRWEIGIILNLILLPLVIFFGLRMFRAQAKAKGEQLVVFMQDLKAALRPSALYCLIVGVFLFMYYGKIDREFINELHKDRMEMLDKAITESGGWAEYKKSIKPTDDFDPLHETQEAYTDKVQQNVETIISPFTAGTASILSLLMLSIVYSLFFTILYRKVLVKFDG